VQVLALAPTDESPRDHQQTEKAEDGEKVVVKGTKITIAPVRGENSRQTTCLWYVGSRSTTVPPDSPDLSGLAIMDWQLGSARTGTDQAIRILHYRPAPLPS